MEERELIRRMRRGDPAALEALMDRDLAFAAGIASSILRDAPRDAEEVVSDSFLALWDNADKLVPGRVRGYLGAIVRNRAKNRLRELGRELPLEEDVLSLAPSSAPGPAESLERAERAALAEELLDIWEDHSVELLPGPEVSPKRIRERTMKLLPAKPKRRLLPRLALCAALAAALTISAVATYQIWGPGSLFDSFFTLESSPLDEGQKALLDEMGTTHLAPSVSNGITMTPLASVADEYNCYLRLRVEAPEGTVLPDMGTQEDHVFLDVDLRDTTTGERLDWGMQKARFLPDSTPGDNVVELVFILYGRPGGVNWNDGVSKTLYLTDLALRPRESTSGETPVVLEGTWSFEMDHIYRSKILELDPAGAAHPDTETQAVVTLESLTLSPLSVSFSLSYPADAGPFVHYELVLVCKDGSTVTINGANGYAAPGPDGPGGRDYFYGVRAFDIPIPLERIDHIQFGDCSILLPDAPQ